MRTGSHHGILPGAFEQLNIFFTYDFWQDVLAKAKRIHRR
ncbi:hypothetical protein EAM_0294 [Erwinia amylovora ATCC 49946]|nr:hypothetical protein EAM_0294 [Erwinia amylovora ATCC 49946]